MPGLCWGDAFNNCYIAGCVDVNTWKPKTVTTDNHDYIFIQNTVFWVCIIEIVGCSDCSKCRVFFIKPYFTGVDIQLGVSIQIGRYTYKIIDPLLNLEGEMTHGFLIPEYFTRVSQDPETLAETLDTISFATEQARIEITKYNLPPVDKSDGVFEIRSK